MNKSESEMGNRFLARFWGLCFSRVGGTGGNGAMLSFWTGYFFWVFILLGWVYFLSTMGTGFIFMETKVGLM